MDMLQDFFLKLKFLKSYENLIYFTALYLNNINKLYNIAILILCGCVTQPAMVVRSEWCFWTRRYRP